MERQNLEGLELITGNYITQIANKALVSREYVKLIITGERETKSVRARAIMAAAKDLNRRIKSASSALDKKFQTVEEID